VCLSCTSLLHTPLTGNCRRTTDELATLCALTWKFYQLSLILFLFFLFQCGAVCGGDGYTVGDHAAVQFSGKIEYGAV